MSLSHHSVRRLSPVLGVSRLIALTFAVIAPVSSVFLTFGTAFQTAGTGIVLGFAVGAIINLAVMFCYAELGSRYPEAGGDYALAARGLGRWAGSVYAALFALKGIAIPALLALSTAAYVHQLWPGFSPVAGGMLIFVAYLALGALNIRASSVVVTIMVTVEFLVFALFIGIAATHLSQPISVLWHPKSGSWAGAVTPALYGLNGPQSCLYYSEESNASPQVLGRTILGAALVTVAVELLAVVLGTLALPTLHLKATTLPLAAVIGNSLGHFGEITVVIAIAMALFDTGTATTMSYARIFFAVGRNHQWPGLFNQITGWLSPQGVPLGALITLGCLNLIVMGLSGIHLLVTLSGTVLIAVYLGIIFATIITRRHMAPPYRMPFWPLPPALALIGLGLTITGLSRYHLILTGLIIVLGLSWAGLASGTTDG